MRRGALLVSAADKLLALWRIFTQVSGCAGVRIMKRFGATAPLLAILGSVALFQLVACDDTKGTAPPAASPANASPQASGAASGESAAPPARHGGGW